jgi:hypothetical protein
MSVLPQFPGDDRGDAMKVIIHDMTAPQRQLAVLASESALEYPDSKSIAVAYGPIDNRTVYYRPASKNRDQCAPQWVWEG